MARTIWCFPNLEIFCGFLFVKEVLEYFYYPFSSTNMAKGNESHRKEKKKPKKVK